MLIFVKYINKISRQALQIIDYIYVEIKADSPGVYE